jgi:hypothetical protein
MQIVKTGMDKERKGHAGGTAAPHHINQGKKYTL